MVSIQEAVSEERGMNGSQSREPFISAGISPKEAKGAATPTGTVTCIFPNYGHFEHNLSLLKTVVFIA